MNWWLGKAKQQGETWLKAGGQQGALVGTEEDLFSTPNTDQIELLRFNKLTVQKFQVLGTGNDESEASRWAHVNYIGLS